MQKSSVHLGLLCVLLSVGTATAFAQVYDLEMPSDSPVWWTLTDDISPGEMKATFADRAAHHERHARAVEAGIANELSEEGSRRLSFYTNTEQNPELTPVWRALDVWARSLVGPYGRPGSLERELSEYGISPSAADRLKVYAAKFVQERQVLIETNKDDQQEFVTIQREMLDSKALSPDTQQAEVLLQRAREQRDLELFARTSGRTTERIAELIATSRIDPGAHAGAASLPLIREDLEPEEWEGFRRYLLERVVPGMGSLTDFDAGIVTEGQ